MAAARTGPGMYGAAASSTGQRPGRGAICLPSTRIPCDGPAGCLRGCSSGMVRVCASQRPICVGLLGKRKAGAPAHACGTRTDTARLPRPASPRSAPSAPPPRAPPQGTKNCAVQSQPGAARGPAPPRRRAAGPHGRSEPPVPPAPPAPPFAAVRSPASARARSLTQRRSAGLGSNRGTLRTVRNTCFFFVVPNHWFVDTHL